MSFDEHMEHIRSVKKFREEFAAIDTLDFEEVNLTDIIENLWQLYKRTSFAMNKMGTHIMEVTKDTIKENAVVKMAVDSYVGQTNAILGMMEKRIDTIEGSLLIWTDLLKQDKGDIVSITIRFEVHKILYQYRGFLEVFDNMLEPLIEGLEKDKSKIHDTESIHSGMFS